MILFMRFDIIVESEDILKLAREGGHFLYPESSGTFWRQTDLIEELYNLTDEEIGIVEGK